MTIGDFRKITENYPDDARIVHWLGHEKLDAQVSALSSS